MILELKHPITLRPQKYELLKMEKFDGETSLWRVKNLKKGTIETRWISTDQVEQLGAMYVKQED